MVIFHYRYCHVTVIVHIVTVIFRIDTVIFRSCSTLKLSSCHIVDVMTRSYLVSLVSGRTMLSDHFTFLTLVSSVRWRPVTDHVLCTCQTIVC
jgi:hypothetical protein